MERPKAILVVSSITALFGCLLVMIWFVQTEHEWEATLSFDLTNPETIAGLMILVLPPILIACAWGLWTGKSWGRTLLVGALVPVGVFGAIFSDSGALAVQIVIAFGVLGYFLFRPAVSSWFNWNAEQRGLVRREGQ